MLIERQQPETTTHQTCTGNSSVYLGSGRSGTPSRMCRVKEEIN